MARTPRRRKPVRRNAVYPDGPWKYMPKSRRLKIYDKFNKVSRRLGKVLGMVAPCCLANMTPAEFKAVSENVTVLEQRLGKLDMALRDLPDGLR